MTATCTRRPLRSDADPVDGCPDDVPAGQMRVSRPEGNIEMNTWYTS